MSAIVMENSAIPTLFERLPAEILFDIFDYLSCNDAVYAFFHLNERLNNSLIQHQHCLRSFELPKTNFDYWEKTLPMIESDIRTLKMNDVKPSFPLTLFSNLTSLIIRASCYGFDEQLKSILENDQFQTLKTFKIKGEHFFKEIIENSSEHYKQKLFRKVFSNGNLLQTFECQSRIESIPLEFFHAFSFHSHLESLTLNLECLIDALLMMQYTPNLKYLNITSEPLVLDVEYVIPKVKRIKLEKFILTFEKMADRPIEMNYQQLKTIIKQFSSSLISLSLDFVQVNIDPADAFLFNGIRLEEELLESMVHLKDFRLYVDVPEDKIDVENVLSSFQYEFYFDHQWYFGARGHYLCSLPLPSELTYDFDCFKPTIDEILQKNSRVWFKVKSITLAQSRKVDLALLTLFKLTMPKLECIRICRGRFKNDRELSRCETDPINVILDNVTTVCITSGSLEDEKHWLIAALPNLKCLSLDSVRLPTLTSECNRILSERIERLVVTGYTNSAQLTESIFLYFPNLRSLEITFQKSHAVTDHVDNSKQVMHLLTSLTNLTSLSVTLVCNAVWGVRYNADKEFAQFVQRLEMSTSKCSYKMKRIDGWVLFSKYQYQN